jgi:aspartokinase
MIYKLLEDYSGNGIDLKKGVYTHEELVKLYETEEKLHFCLTCTNLKEYLELVDTQEVQEVIIPAATEEKISIVFLVEKEIKQKKKVVFKVGEKLTFEQLEGFDIAKLAEEGFIIETKVLG